MAEKKKFLPSPRFPHLGPALHTGPGEALDLLFKKKGNGLEILPRDYGGEHQSRTENRGKA